MMTNAKTRRRVFGALCLAVSIGMVIAGETVLKATLSSSPTGFLGYWLGCLLFTALAVCAALLDARSLRAESRKAHQELFEDTFREVRHDKASHSAADSSRKNN